MHLEGTYEFETNQQVVWDMLQDPQVIGSIIPGANGLQPMGDNKYQSVIVVKVGPVQGRFEANIELADLTPPDGYRLIFHGSSPVGLVDGEGVVQLAEAAGVTTMFYSGDAVVGGKIATVGQRLLDVAAKAIAKQALNALARKIRGEIEANESAATE
jgi:carbon monoxide dehydrogenase subunit G